MLNRTKLVLLKQHPTTLLFGVFFFSFAIQFIGIDSLSLTSDECFSIYHAQMSPRLIYLHLSSGNNPPLHEWILHYWMQWFGDSALSVRVPSLIFNALTATFMCKLSFFTMSTASSSVQRSVGIFSVLLFLGSNYSTFLSHEARAYNLLMFLGTWNTLIFLRVIIDLREGQAKFKFFLWGFTGGLLALTHFFGLWIILAQVVGIFILHAFSRSKNSLFETKKAIQRLLVGALGFLITFGWYIPSLWRRFSESASQGTWVNPAPWDAPYTTLWKYFNNPLTTILALFLLLTLAFIIAKKLFKSNSFRGNQINSNTYLILWLFAFPFFTMWILSLNHPYSIPMFTERYASFTLPFICISIAISTQILLKKSQQTLILQLLIAVLLLMGKIFTPPNFAAGKESLKWIEARTQNSPNTPLIVEPYHAAFQALYYLDHARFKEYHPSIIYEHLATQLSRSNVWILKSNNSLDSLGLRHSTKLSYLHFGSEKSAHTQRVEVQLRAMTNKGGTIESHNIQIPKYIWGGREIKSEAEFWFIERK